MGDSVSSNPSAPPQRWHFGQFDLDLSAGELRKSGLRIRIQEQPLRILGALLERPGEVVSREDLRERLWPSDTFVDFERSLNAAVAKLRQALTDSAEQPRYVETVARRGYRFIAPVEASSYLERNVQAPPGSDSGTKRWTWLAGSLAIIAGVVIALAVVYFRKPLPETTIVRSAIPPPEKAAFTGPVAMSPDGRRLAFGATTAGGKSQLWVRPLDALTAQPLAGTEGAKYPFWSPDSRWLGFFADGKLKKIEAGGGPALTLCGAPNGVGGTWSRDGVIVFAPSSTVDVLYQVSANGGVASPVTTLDRTRGETDHRWPWFLPDGRHFLYLAGTGASGGAIRAGSISNKADSKVLVESMFNAVYSQGYLLFLRDTTLMAQPFDAKRLATTADAVPVAEGVQALPGVLDGVFSLSENGVLVYRTGGASAGAQLAWFDRSGKQIATLGDRGLFGTLHLSPDGTRASVSLLDPIARNRDIWLYDVSRGMRSRFTYDPAEERESAWSPDGRTIVFNSHRKGYFDLYLKPSSGVGPENLLLASDSDKYPASFSPDGKFLLYWTQGANIDLWVLPMSGERKPFPFAQAAFKQNRGRFAPNGRFISYESEESGQFEIYIAPFPGPGSKRQISTSGGIQAIWKRDGKEIFYIARDNWLIAQEMSINGDVSEVGPARRLFGPVGCGSGSCYDVSADGQRFLVRTEPEAITAESLTLVQNWTAAIRK